MNFFIKFLIFNFIIISGYHNAYSTDEVSKFYIKVLEVDSNLRDNEILKRYKSVPRQFFFSIIHLKVLTQNHDTMYVAKVFDTKYELENAMRCFGIKAGDFYQLTVSIFTPCNSDFPFLDGCNSNISTLFNPLKCSIIKERYESIYRIIDIIPVDKIIAEELFEY